MRPPITIVATTYFPPEAYAVRQAAFAETLATWGARLGYQGELRLHVADDGSPEGNQIGVSPFPFTLSRQERCGVGASLNLGFAQAFEHSPLVLYAVDDWSLRQPFDLTLWADLLMEREDVGCVRLGPPHPNTRGTVEMFSVSAEPPANPERGGWFLRLDPYAYAFGHRPALYHRRFLEAFGWFAEGVNALECERLYAERYVRGLAMWPLANPRQPEVVLALPHPWHHIDSVELAELVPGSER